jgi:pantetheine-phosphate adenylyltransferase
MRIAVYPGSFDPITKGHEDIIRRASKIFDEVVVAVLINPSKEGIFTKEERVELIKKVTGSYENVRVECCSTLLVKFMEEKKSKVIIKGLRAVSDFEYEFQMALMNNKLDDSIETLFMVTSVEYSYLSSSSVKQVAMFGGDIKGLVSDEIMEDVKNKIKLNI